MKRSDSILQNYYMSRLPKAQDGKEVKLITTDNKTYNLTPKDPLYHWFYGQRGTNTGQSYIKTKNPDGSWNLSVSSSDIPSEYLEPYYSKVETGEPVIINVVPERKRAAQTREAVIGGNDDAEFTFPDGTIKKWKDMNWREQYYVSGKNLGSLNAGNWTDWINPVAMIGSMGESLGTSPYVAQKTDSYLPYVAGVGAPLLTGALAGLGAKNVGQFAENIISPIPGRISNIGNAVRNKYIDIAEGSNPFNYAWRSPARGITDQKAREMFLQVSNDVPLDYTAKDLLADYQHTSGPFTGRFESGNINLFKRSGLEDAIAQRNVVSSTGRPIVLTRRFDPKNPELYGLNEAGIFESNRPTSWSVGKGADYTTKKDRLVVKLPSGSRGLVNEYNATKYGQDVEKLIEEHELILGSGSGFKPLGKVKNELGGYDYIHRFQGYSPTIWDDIRGLNVSNLAERVDLSKNIAKSGNFNYGIYPFKKDPNILVKLGKTSQNEMFGINNPSIKTGIPEDLKDFPTEAWRRMAIPFREVDLSGLTAKQINQPGILEKDILGTLMKRIEGKPLAEYSIDDLSNIEPYVYQGLARDVKQLANKNVGVDFYGNNFHLDITPYGHKSFNLFDFGRLPTPNTGAFPVSALHGLDAKAFSQGIKQLDSKMLKSMLGDKLKNAIYESAQKAGEGAYTDQQVYDAIQKALKNISQSNFKKGGPVVNPRGYIDGEPPKGSNWRIPGNGAGTSITMDLPNMPDEILVVPDGDFDQAKVMKRGEEEYFAGADFVDEYSMGPGGTTGPKIAVRDYPTMKGGGLSPNKAREILHHGEVHGHPLTEKQRKFFGVMSKGHTNQYQIGGLTDDEKREMAKRIVSISKQRAKDRKWVDVPESIKNSPEGQNEGTNACIGGVCSVLQEAGAIPNIIWSNTEFSKQAPQLGFPNRGWGLKGIENLEPGDVVQWMDRGYKNEKKAFPHHAQIFVGVNKDGEYEFWDNYNKEIRPYDADVIEDQLSWSNKPGDSQMQIYKINPYNPPGGVTINPEAQRILEERKRNIKYQTDDWGRTDYAYNLREDSPLKNNTPVGVKEFLSKANNYAWISDVVRKVDKAGYPSRATRAEVHDSLLNVFGILGQENKWQNPWIGGDIAPSWMPQIPLESTIERAASPSTMSIGPGQIKFSELSKPIRKAFGIKRRQDLQDWDKVIPLMVGMDIANKQWMENQGERFSERVIGDPGLTSQQMKWSEGRMSPYFYRGLGVSDVRDYVGSLADDTWYDVLLPKFERTRRQMKMDPTERDQFVKENIRKYQKVFDPGSYGRRVWENWANNLERTMTYPEETITLPEVILSSKPRPRRQLGGNALAMLRDYGTGISVPRLNSPAPKAENGGGFGVFGYVGDGWYKNGGQHGGLDRWFAEKWVDIKSGKQCGRQEGESRAYPACRPSKRVSSKTPKTSGEMSSAEKAKFKSSKTSSQRISYNHKRR